MNYNEPNIPNLKIPVQGKIVKILPTQTFGTSGTKSRKFWLEHESQPNDEGKTFKNTLPFELVSRAGAKFDNTAELDNLGVGTVVKFLFQLGGRVWNGTPEKPAKNGPQCFTSLRVVSKLETVGKATNPGPSYAPAPAVPDSSVSYNDVADDMPF